MINLRMTTTFLLIRVLVMLALLKVRTVEGSAIAASALSFLSRRPMVHMKASTHLMIKAVIMCLPYLDNPRTT